MPDADPLDPAKTGWVQVLAKGLYTAEVMRGPCGCLRPIWAMQQW